MNGIDDVQVLMGDKVRTLLSSRLAAEHACVETLWGFRSVTRS